MLSEVNEVDEILCKFPSVEETFDDDDNDGVGGGNGDDSTGREAFVQELLLRHLSCFIRSWPAWRIILYSVNFHSLGSEYTLAAWCPSPISSAGQLWGIWSMILSLV